MSIRAIARELYRAQQNVSRLEKELEVALPPEQESLHEELRHAKAELQVLRKILNGEKESSSFQKKFKGFGR